MLFSQLHCQKGFNLILRSLGRRFQTLNPRHHPDVEWDMHLNSRADEFALASQPSTFKPQLPTRNPDLYNP